MSFKAQMSYTINKNKKNCDFDVYLNTIMKNFNYYDVKKNDIRMFRLNVEALIGMNRL